MLSQRLTLALETDAVSLPEEGVIAVIGPDGAMDLSMLPKDRIQVVQRHFPHHAAFQRQGFETATQIGTSYAAAIVCLPRAKSEARQMLAAVRAATDGPIVIDGQKTDGIDSILKEAKKRGQVGEVISKAHGKIFAVTDANFSDWATTVQNSIGGGFKTAPGVFSADGVDPGSALLAETLPRKLPGRVVDLGAGWGFLSDAILKREGVARVDLVESDHAALEMARLNITDERAVFHWADAREFRPEALADHVVTNPPFHQGRSADPSLGRAFIASAAAMLTPRGQLWLVANRHLPYEQALEDAFSTVQTLGQTPSFKLFHAASPKRRRKG
ncbi:MAG: methyltransferase [Boseongicola sp.]|nr:MAG: methyltransferase [Boseongicola sp.]